VSESNKIAGCISTSSALTARGKSAVGKYHKIRGDALYLNAAVGVAKKFLLFTDEQMKAYFEKERDNGRFPQDIELLYAPLPADLGARLQESADVASREVTPSKWPVSWAADVSSAPFKDGHMGHMPRTESLPP
jgi:hypothetical protein